LVVVSTRKWPQESNYGLSKAVGLVKKKGKGVTHGSYNPIQVDRRPRKGTSSYKESQSGSEVPQGNKNSLAVLLV